jgi:hypothetical protein
MEHHEHPTGRGQDDADEVSWFTVLAIILAVPLTICVGIVYLLHSVEFGPGVGDIVAFNSTTDLRDLDQLRIPAEYAATNGTTRGCILSPSIIAESGGSLVIEAKETTTPPAYRVHWAGPRTDDGATNCGTTADLQMKLTDLRVLANAAGGFGVARKHGVF